MIKPLIAFNISLLESLAIFDGWNVFRGPKHCSHPKSIEVIWDSKLPVSSTNQPGGTILWRPRLNFVLRACGKNAEDTIDQALFTISDNGDISGLIPVLAFPTAPAAHPFGLPVPSARKPSIKLNNWQFSVEAVEARPISPRDEDLWEYGSIVTIDYSVAISSERIVAMTTS